MPTEEEHRTETKPQTPAQAQPEPPATEAAPPAIEPPPAPEVVQPGPAPQPEPALVQEQPSVEPAPETGQPEPTPPAPAAQPTADAQPAAEAQPAGEAQPGADQPARPSRRGVPPPKDPEVGGYICDAMLGRLARELRIRGLDVFYQRNLGGMMAFRQSRSSGRTLLTRNNRLKGLPGVVMMESTNIREQVAQVTGQPVEPAPEPVQPEPGVPAEEAAAVVQPEPQESRATVEQPQAERPAPERPEPRSQQQRERRPEPRREQRQQTRQEPRPQPQVQPRPDQEPAFGRCLACNTPLEQISRDAARPSIPFFIYQIHHDFRRCPKCKKVFWPGSHVQDMERRARPAGRFPRRGGRGRR